MNEDDTVAVTMRFPKGLYDKLKVASLVRNTSINGLVIDLLQDVYGNNKRIEAINQLVQEARDEGHIR